MLCTVKPKRVGGVVDCDAPLREGGGPSCDRHVPRIDTLGRGGHPLTGVGECRLGNRLVGG